MKTLFSFLFVFSASILFAQYTNIPADLLNKAHTAKEVNYLSLNEKEVILYINLARIDGKWFIENIINKHSNFVNENSKKYVRSLISDLQNSGNLAPLYPAKGLTKAAHYHAKDMGETGKTGHQSSDGTPTFTRIKKYAKGGYMAENCQNGYKDQLKIVLDLLIDDGIPTYGHRKNILSPNYKYIGVAIEPHLIYGVNCVQDFSDTGD
jgi:uncharacterized protein YkwD